MGDNDHVEFVGNIIKPLCEKPELVVIDSKDDDRGTLVNVYVDQPDMGRVLGRGGETVNAIRLLLKVYAMKHEKHFGLKINAVED